MYYFYILQCRDGTLYCGITNNLDRRVKQHNFGKGSKYVKTHGGGTIVYSENFSTINQALKREVEVKKWKRAKKLLLINRPG